VNLRSAAFSRGTFIRPTRRMLYMTLIRVGARHTACARLIQRRVPRENAIDRRSPVVWGANWALKSSSHASFMNGCFDNQLPAIVFDGVKTSPMVCQAVTIGRDVRGAASLAWGGMRGTCGDWSVIDHAAQPLPTPPLSPPRTFPSSVLNYSV